MSLLLNRSELRKVINNSGLRSSAESLMGMERISRKLLESAILLAKERRDRTLRMIHFLPSQKKG